MHTQGNNWSIWTSWTTDKATAENFATNGGEVQSGVVLVKQFKRSRFGVDIIQSLNADEFEEYEWLVPGIQKADRIYYVNNPR